MKTPILFLHGFPFNGSAWMPQAEALKQERKVLTPDLRGHGNGPSGAGPWMIGNYVEDMKALLEKEKIDKVILCGLSMGGYIAQQFIEKYPDKLHALILCDTRADADSNETKEKRLATIQKLQGGDINAFAKEFTKSVLSESTVKEKPQIQKQVEEMISTNKASDLAFVVGALASRHDNTKSLEKINCPTLVIVGTDDKLTPPEVNQVLADKIKGTVFKKIDKAGHLSNLEQPEKFNEILKEFLNTLN